MGKTALSQRGPRPHSPHVVVAGIFQRVLSLLLFFSVSVLFPRAASCASSRVMAHRDWVMYLSLPPTSAALAILTLIRKYGT